MKMVFGFFKKKKKEKFFRDLEGYEKPYFHEKSPEKKDILERAFETGMRTPFDQEKFDEKTPELNVEEHFKAFLPKQNQEIVYSTKPPQNQRENLALIRKEIELLGVKIDSLKANFEVINTRLRNIEAKLREKERSW